VYERMLNKQIIPSLNDIYETIGKESILYFEKLHQFMIDSYELSIRLKFLDLNFVLEVTMDGVINIVIKINIYVIFSLKRVRLL